MRDLSAGRFKINQYGKRDGDCLDLEECHGNGSGVKLGTLTVRGDELHDVIYILQEAKAQRDKELTETGR